MSVPVSSAPTASLTPAPPTLRQWVKAHDNWHTNALYRLAKTCTTFSVPLIPGVHRLLYWLHRAIAATWASTTRIVWFTPLFQSRLERSAARLYVYIVGDNVDIGWQTTIAVGRTITLGNNVRMAGRAFLAGYPGHPLAAAARAADTDDQIGDIVLEDDVWLATGVTVSAGVRIGRGTVVAAGSVVTADLPPGVLAAGAPARVVRQLTAENGVS